MNDLITTAASLPDRCISAALAGLAPATRRVYDSHISKYLTWSAEAVLTRESVKAYIRSLELSGASPQVRNQALAALKKLAHEAGELAWIEPGASAQIQSIKSKKVSGIRSGRWLTIEQVAQLLGAVDRTNIIGKRDAAVLALLIGCGLRRAEACELDTAQLRAVAGRTIIMNLKGKGGRVRSIGVPAWAQTLVAQWQKLLLKETAQ